MNRQYDNTRPRRRKSSGKWNYANVLKRPASSSPDHRQSDAVLADSVHPAVAKTKQMINDEYEENAKVLKSPPNHPISSQTLLRSGNTSCVNGSQQQAIYRGCINDVTATWAYDIMKYLDCWEIQVIEDKG
jgi:hypothetical protein